MLFCSNKKKRCEGATHGMIVSTIVLIVVFNGYFFNVIKDLQFQDDQFQDQNTKINIEDLNSIDPELDIINNQNDLKNKMGDESIILNMNNHIDLIQNQKNNSEFKGNLIV